MSLTHINPVLAFYRRMMKTLKKKFFGDDKTYSELRYAMKMETLSHKHQKDPITLAKFIFSMDTMRDWLLTEVIRADLQEDGQYKLRIDENHLKGISLKGVKHPEYFYFKVPENLIS